MTTCNSSSVDHLLPPCVGNSASRAPIENLEPQDVRPRLRWFGKYSLRTLLFVQLVLALFFGWIGARLYSFREQRAVVAAVTRRHVSFNYQLASPRWFWSSVEQITGIEAKDYVSATNSDAALTLEEASQIGKLHYLETMYIQRGITEPAVVDELARLPNLTWLDLRDLSKLRLKYPERSVSLDDESMRRLARCTSIRRLTIDSAGVTDKGIAALAAMPNVECLHIVYAKVSIQGLRPWIAKNKLRELSIPFRLTAADSAELSRFTSLQRLELYELKPECAEHISRLPNLRRLEIRGPFFDRDAHDPNSTLPERIEIWHGNIQFRPPTVKLSSLP
jgi:hypothetical protein